MRTLIVSEFVSLDGVIQAPGGKDEDRDGGFEHGGWTMPYWHDDIGASFGVMMRRPGWAFNVRTASTTLSRMMVVSRQMGFDSVRDTTYFFGAFMRSPNGSPGGIGSNASA